MTFHHFLNFRNKVTQSYCPAGSHKINIQPDLNVNVRKCGRRGSSLFGCSRSGRRSERLRVSDEVQSAHPQRQRPPLSLSACDMVRHLNVTSQQLQVTVKISIKCKRPWGMCMYTLKHTHRQSEWQCNRVRGCHLVRENQAFVTLECCPGYWSIKCVMAVGNCFLHPGHDVKISRKAKS